MENKGSDSPSGNLDGSRTKEKWSTVRGDDMSPSIRLGPVNSESLIHDAKHLGFTLARYKFATKMLRRSKHIVEIGCGEGLGTLMYLADTSARVTALDFDASQIAYAREEVLPHGRDRLEFLCQDMITTPLEGQSADGLVCLDVIEHVHPDEEEQFIRNCASILQPGGVAVIGTPNKDAERYASERSKVGHINTFEPDRLVAALDGHFSQVFLFSMNDEMVHTGFSRMAHYLMTLCIK